MIKTKIYISQVFIAVLLVLTACSKDPNALLQSAKKYEAEKKYSEAALELRKAINLSPQFVEAHYELGLIYLGTGDLGEADQEFNRILVIQPDNAGARMKHGILALLQRRFEDASTDAQAILKKDPANLHAQILLANSYAGIIDVNDSIEEVRRAVEMQPRLLPAYFDLSSTPGFKRKAEPAEQLYKGAIEANRQSIEAHLALANFYLQSGNTSEAEKEYKAAVTFGPASRDANQALGYFYLQTQQLDSAEQVYLQQANSHPEDPGARIVLAEFYSTNGKLEKAITILEELNAKQPTYLLGKRTLASLFLDKKDLAKAEQLTDETLKADPKDLDAQLLKGRILLAQKRTSEGVAQLQRLVRARAASPLGRYFLGLAYSQAQDFQKAGQEFSAAIQNDAGFVQAYIPLAQLKLDSGDVDAAMGYARQAVSFNAGLADAHLVLCRAFLSVKDYNSAAAEAESVLRADPKNWAALYHSGLVALAQENFAQAETRFEASFKGSPPDRPESLQALSNLYVQQKRPEKAIQRVNQAIAESPTNPVYYRTLALILLGQDDKAKAEQAFEKAVSLDPRDFDQRIALAQFFATTGNLDKGVNALQAVVKEDPANDLAERRLAELYIAKGQYDKAVESADDILKRNNKDADGLVIKGRALLAQKKNDDAISQLKTALSIDPASATVRYHLGYAYLQTGDKQRAESEWLEAIKTAGPFLAPYISLAELKLESGDSQAAARYSQRALAANPNLSQAQFILASATKNPGELRKASTLLQDNVAKKPEDAEQRQRLGALLLEQRDFAGAEAQYSAALKVSPDSEVITRGLAGVYLAQKQPDRAIKLLTEQISKFPRQAGFFKILSDIYIDQKDYVRAEESLQKGVQADPQNATAKLSLAQFYEMSRQLGKAAPVYEELLRNDAGNSTLKRTLANVYLDQRTFDRASQLIDEVLKKDNKDTDAQITKGRILLGQNKITEALTQLQSASNANPNSAPARYYLGLAYLQANKVDQAEAAWNDALQIDPRYLLADLSLAQLKLASLDATRAERYAEDALKVDPNLADALLVLGNAQLLKREYKAAVSTFETLAKLRPDNAIAVERLGSAYAVSGDSAKAEAQFESALRINPKSMDALSALTNLYLREGKSDKAIQKLNQTGQSLNQSAVYELLGKVYLNQKNYSKAEESYKKALSLDANNIAVYGALGELFLVQKATDKAVQEYESILKVDPKSSSAHTMLGMIYDMQNMGDKAEPHYREALKINPHSPVAATNLAWIILDSGGNLDDALRLAQTANDELPNRPTILDTLGWIYYKKGAFASAVDMLKDCVRRAPDEPTYHYHLGMAYFRMRNLPAARASLDQALKLNKSFRGIEEAKRTLSSL